MRRPVLRLRSCATARRLDETWAAAAPEHTAADHLQRVKRLAVVAPLPRVLGGLHRLRDTAKDADERALRAAYECAMRAAATRREHWLVVELALRMGRDGVPLPDRAMLALATDALAKMDTAPPTRETCALLSSRHSPAVCAIAQQSKPDVWKFAVLGELNTRFPASALAPPRLPASLQECSTVSELDAVWSQRRSHAPSEHMARIKKLAVVASLPRVVGALNRLAFTTDVAAAEPRFLQGAYAFVMDHALKKQCNWLPVELLLAMGASPRAPPPATQHVAMALSGALRLAAPPSRSTASFSARRPLLRTPLRILDAHRRGGGAGGDVEAADGFDWKQRLVADIASRLPAPPSRAGLHATTAAPTADAAKLRSGLPSAPRYLATQAVETKESLTLALEDAANRAHGTLALEALQRMREKRFAIPGRLFAMAADAMVRDRVIKVKHMHLRALEQLHRAEPGSGRVDAGFASNLIVGFASVDAWDDVDRLLGEFAPSVKLSAEAYAAGIRAQRGRHDAWKRVEAILKRMADQGVEHGTKTVNALLAVAAAEPALAGSDGVFKAAAGWFAQLVDGKSNAPGGLPLASDARPNAETYARASELFASRNDVAALDALIRSGGTKPAFGAAPFLALVRVYGALRRPSDAARVVGDMQRLGVPVDSSTVDALADALADAGEGLLGAGHIVGLCKSRGVAPSKRAAERLVASAPAADQARVRAALAEWL